MCGILTDRDIAMKVAGEERDPLTTMVEEVMTRDPVRISVDREVRDVMSLMHTHHVRRIPDHGHPGDRSWNRHYG